MAEVLVDHLPLNPAWKGRIGADVVAYAKASSTAAHLRPPLESFLTGAFAALTADNVLPRSLDEPWLPAHRTRNEAVAFDHAPPALKAIVAAYPERFGEDVSLDRSEFPEIYLHGLLRGAVAWATLHGDALTSSSPSVAYAVSELLWRLRSSEQPTVVIRVVSGLIADSEETGKLHGLRFRPVPATVHEAVAHELPEAAHTSRWIGGGSRTSLVVADAQLAPRDFDGLRPVRDRIAHLLTGIRLATGGTLQEVAEVTGEPLLTHMSPPQVSSYPHDLFPFGQRPVRLGPQHASAVSDLAKRVEQVDVFRGTKEAMSPLVVALGRYNRSHRASWWHEAIVDLAIALEAALTTQDDRTELGAKLSYRAAHLLGSEDDPPETLFDDVKALYGLRSRVVHGDAMSPDEVTKGFRKVSTVTGDAPPYEAIPAGLDRFRDLVRRALVARLFLAEAARPWPFLGRLKVDQALVDPQQREVWRRHLDTKSSELGLSSLASRASPLLSYGELKEAGF